MAAQALIEDAHEKSINLNEIPGLLTIKKITPKRNEVNTRVTQVCGSIEGKDMLKVVKSIKDQKKKKIQAQKEKEDQKLSEKETFYKCKDRFGCHSIPCEALKLKECPYCHNILRSVCGKLACRNNGERPVMIVCSFASSKLPKSTRGKYVDSDDSLDEMELTDNESEFDSDSELDKSLSFTDTDEIECGINQMKETWKYISPPNNEEEIIGKWFAVVYKGKKTENLFIAKAVRRFLLDEMGSVDSILMRCLKAKMIPQRIPCIFLYYLAAVFLLMFL